MLELATVTVSIQDIKAGAKACAASSEASKLSRTADADRDIALMAVFEPLLGIKTQEELKALSIEQIRRMIRKRVDSGVLKLKGISADVLIDRVIQQTQVRRNVAWRDVFTAELGESRAVEVMEATPETHSYKLVVP